MNTILQLLGSDNMLLKLGVRVKMQLALAKPLTAIRYLEHYNQILEQTSEIQELKTPGRWP